MRSYSPFTEIVEGSGGGLLFESEDELRGALAELGTNARKRRELGAAGHRALLANWTESVVLKKYFEVIARIAEKKNQSLAQQLAGQA